MIKTIPLSKLVASPRNVRRSSDPQADIELKADIEARGLLQNLMTGPALKEAERVERAAAALSPLEREILVLSAGLRLNAAEIARRLGISERRSERLLARALRKFDRALEYDGRRRWRWW